MLRFVAALIVLLGARVAHADVVTGGWICPPGAYGDTSHLGPFCVPAECERDSDCNGSDRCRPYRVCTKVTVLDFFRYGSRDGGFPREEIVVGTCAPSAGCVGGEDRLPMVGKVAPGPATCRVGSYCVPPDAPPLPAPGRRRGPPLPPFRDGGRWGAFHLGVAALSLALVIGIVVVVLLRRGRR